MLTNRLQHVLSKMPSLKNWLLEWCALSLTDHACIYLHPGSYISPWVLLRFLPLKYAIKYVRGCVNGSVTDLGIGGKAMTLLSLAHSVWL